MRTRLTTRRCVLAVAFAALQIALAAPAANAGEYSVANCQADPVNFSTRAFDQFITRGMRIKRACNPEGPGVRGLVTGNVIRAGQIPRGSVALASIKAPVGTQFTTFRWAGSVQRRDCRYALQLWAEGPGISPIPIKNVRAMKYCPRPTVAQAAGYMSRVFKVAGATRIVQRAICIGGRGTNVCAARSSNYIRTNQAEVGIVDVSPPTATILGDTPLARGEWVGGIQPLNYDASDNVGVRLAHAFTGGKKGGSEQRPCAFADPDRTFADRVPCPNGPGQIAVDTTGVPEGSQSLVVQAQDTAGNFGESAPTKARIDNTPPNRVDVSVEGGDRWRNRNDFALAWANATEADRAPIAAVGYEFCQASGGSCNRAEQGGADIARLELQVPAPGEWTVSLWRRDAAGNETENAASVPVALRYDPEPPQLGFEPPNPGDPTLVGVEVTDKVSGLADGAIEISPSGSGIWQALATRKEGGRLLARIDDAALPAGGYELRARAVDQAGNQASTGSRVDGQPMTVTLPLRTVATMRAGFERMRTIRRIVRRDGKRRPVRRRVPVLAPKARVGSGKSARVVGRLVNPAGVGISGAEVSVLSRSVVDPEHLVTALTTGADGRYQYTAAGSTSRTLRFVYSGSPVALPAERAVTMSVPAQTAFRVNRKRVLNGEAVSFSGRLQTEPVPAGGKLVELQVRLSDRWQTFRTSRTDGAGRWEIGYQFKRTRGVQRFRFRARLPAEAGYPFVAGRSRPLKVQVTGL